MPLLAEDSIVYFLKRFWSFDDAIIRRIDHRYLSSGSQQLTVVLSTRDQEAADGWSNVIIEVQGVTELLFREGRSTRAVLSAGLHLRTLQDQVWLDFSPYTSEPVGLEDFRRSDFYVAGKSVTWNVLPYSEE